jgi:serine/threonine-protein kinase
MNEVYAEQIAGGPLVDSTSLRQSFESISGSFTAQEATPKPRRGWIAKAVTFAAITVAVTTALVFGLRTTQGPSEVSESVEAVETDTDEAETPVEPEGEAAARTVVMAVTGSVRIESTPRGAAVHVDAEAADGVTPLVLEGLDVGAHQIVGELPGYERWEGQVEVTAGEVVDVVMPLTRRRPPPAAAPPGRLSINTRPWSKVYVGRRVLGTTPIGNASVPSGTLRLRLVDRDGQTHRETVHVEPGESQSVSFNLGQ